MDKPTINIEWVLDKLKPYIYDYDLSVQTINCLNYYRFLQNLSSEKTIEQIKKQIRMFHIFTTKINDILNRISNTNEDSNTTISQIKSKIEIRKKQILNKKDLFDLKTFPDQKKNHTGHKKHNRQQKPIQIEDDQMFHQELISRVVTIKDDAMNVKKALDHGKQIIDSALTNQEYIQNMVTNVTKSLNKMLSNPDLSLFRLIFMSIMALLLFLFTALFILAF